MKKKLREKNSRQQQSMKKFPASKRVSIYIFLLDQYYKLSELYTVKPVLSGHSKRLKNMFSRPIVA